MGNLMFKNAAVFRLIPDAIDLASLDECLQRQVFQPCGGAAAESVGWVETTTGAGLTGCQVEGQGMLTLKVETKVVPGSALKSEVAKRVGEIAEKEGRRVGRKETKEIEAVVRDGLLGRALPSYKQVRVWLDTKNNWLVVDSSSPKVTDIVLATLSKSLDKPVCRLLKTKQSPTASMTAWLASGDAPEGFSVDMDCSLRGAEGQTVRFAKHSLEGQVQKHLEEGKVPVALGMTFGDRASFVLTEGGQLKKLAFVDAIIAAHKENTGSCETAHEAALADLVFMGGELRELLVALVGILGGELDSVGKE